MFDETDAWWLESVAWIEDRKLNNKTCADILIVASYEEVIEIIIKLNRDVYKRQFL